MPPPTGGATAAGGTSGGTSAKPQSAKRRPRSPSPKRPGALDDRLGSPQVQQGLQARARSAQRQRRPSPPTRGSGSARSGGARGAGSRPATATQRGNPTPNQQGLYEVPLQDKHRLKRDRAADPLAKEQTGCVTHSIKSQYIESAITKGEFSSTNRRVGPDGKTLRTKDDRDGVCTRPVPAGDETSSITQLGGVGSSAGNVHAVMAADFLEDPGSEWRYGNDLMGKIPWETQDEQARNGALNKQMAGGKARKNDELVHHSHIPMEDNVAAFVVTDEATFEHLTSLTDPEGRTGGVERDRPAGKGSADKRGYVYVNGKQVPVLLVKEHNAKGERVATKPLMPVLRNEGIAEQGTPDRPGRVQRPSQNQRAAPPWIPPGPVS